MAAAIPPGLAIPAGYRPVEVWAPQPGPQFALCACPTFEILFGGARGGGKTDGMLGEWLGHGKAHGRHANGVFFRRELTQLDEAIARSQAIYSHAGGRWRDQKKTWQFSDGSRLKFRFLERDTDAEKYQGHSYSRVYFEELTNFPSPGPVMKLMATLRSSEHGDIGFRATANPGGPGHFWVKARYITPAPLGWQILQDRFFDPIGKQWRTVERVFIPSRLGDNRKLLDADPMYVARLQQSGNAELVRAWLEGDWNVAVGAFFPEFGLRHVIPTMPLPEKWPRYLAHDWGSSAPFSVQWIAVATDPLEAGAGVVIPRGALVVYREWYGASSPGVGLKLTAEELAEGIVQRCTLDEWKNPKNVAGLDLFKEDGGPSLHERMYRHRKVMFGPADTSRLAGWDQVRSRLKGEGDKGPMLYVMDCCTDLIRTLPGLPHDEANPEDIDTEAEDHAADALRYGCMARPYLPALPADRMAGKPKAGTFDWLLQVTSAPPPASRNRRIIRV